MEYFPGVPEEPTIPHTGPPHPPEIWEQLVALPRAGHTVEELAQELKRSAQIIGN